MADLILLPGRLDVFARPGSQHTVRLLFGEGELDGSAWAATVDGAPVDSIAVDGDDLLVSFTVPDEVGEVPLELAMTAPVALVSIVGEVHATFAAAGTSSTTVPALLAGAVAAVTAVPVAVGSGAGGGGGGFLTGLAAEYATTNPVLEAGVAAYMLDNHDVRMGDGITAWNDLGPFGSAELDANRDEVPSSTTTGTQLLELPVLELNAISDGSRPLVVDAFLPSVISSQASTTGRLSMFVDDVLAQLAQGFTYNSGGTQFCPIDPLHWEKVLPAGEHTFEFYLNRISGSGNLVVNNNPLFPSISSVSVR